MVTLQYPQISKCSGSLEMDTVFYEDVKITRGDTVANLAVAYGHHAADAAKIWADSQNDTLRSSRTTPDKLAVGDILNIPIPWKIVSGSLRENPATISGGKASVSISLKRNGAFGTRLSWVQTVNRGNQPIGHNPSSFCVDACIPDDDLPFYWTKAEIRATPVLHKEFSDRPSRNPPTAAMGMTKWRAITSVAVVTDQRVTVYGSQFWGFNLDSTGTLHKVGIRDATDKEIEGHLSLLRNGIGTKAKTFKQLGWTFRTPP